MRRHAAARKRWALVVLPVLCAVVGLVTTSAQAVSLPPDISVQSVSPQDFSPNGDDIDDTATLTFCLNSAANVTAQVTDADSVVRVLATGRSFQSGCWNRLEWDGTTDDGSPAPNGTYQIALVAQNDSPQQGSASTEVTLDRRLPGTITSPTPQATLTGTATFAFTPTDGFDVTRVSFYMSGSQVSCSSPTISTPDSDGAFRYSWDTATDCGDGARSLTAQVSWSDGYGSQHWWTTPATDVTLSNPAAPVVSVDSYGQQVLSPNGDGQEDEFGLRWCAADDVDGGDVDTVVRVRNSSGSVVRTLDETVAAPAAYCQLWWGGGTSVSWDGARDDGSQAPDGDYTVEVASTDATGLTGTQTLPVTVDRRLPGTVTAPAADATVAGTSSFVFTPTDGFAVNRVSFYMSGSQVSCSSPTISTPDSDGAFRYSWDTATDCGDGVRSLTASVNWTDAFGQTHWWTSPVTQVQLSNPAAPVVSVDSYGQQVFSPNGDGQEDEFGLRWCAADDVDGGDVDTVVRVRNSSGSVVRTLDETVAAPAAYCQLWWGGGNYLTWDGADDDGSQAPDGDYTVEVASTDATGLTGTQTLPVTVDRRVPGIVTSPVAGSTVAGTASFAFTPTDGVAINQVDYYLGGVSFSAYNASQDGIWRTTQPVGSMPLGATTLSYSVQWTDQFGTVHWFSGTVPVAVDPISIPLTVDQDAVSGTAPYTARLTVHASDPNSATLRADVDWGDGTAAVTEQIPAPYDPLALSHDYATAGTYRVLVSVSNGAGGYASQTVPIEVAGHPDTAPQVTVAATPTSGVAPLDTVTSLSATDVDADPLTYKVDFGDGSAVATGSLPHDDLAHRYTGAGTYLQRVEITDGQLSVVRWNRIVVGLSAPLTALAGDALTGVVGTPVHLDGGGSTPAAGITSYTWDPGDDTGTQSGQGLDHTYTKAGTYTATLTVRSGSATATGTTTVTITDPPAPRGLTVHVTDGGSPVSGAQLTVIRPDGSRVTGTTGADGSGLVPDLPDGSVTAYVLASGYRPAVATGTVTDGHGDASVALTPGDVGAATLEQHEMSIEEIQAAGIDVADPENTHVYEAEIHLYFEPDAPPAQGRTVPVYVTPGGLRCASDCTPSPEVPSCSPTGDNPCYYVPPSTDPSDTSGGYTYYPQVIYVAAQPVIQWLVLPVRASFLKEFFQVQMIVQNLTTGFTFTNGAATLNLPAGLSLAPTSTPQSLTPAVPDVPGGESRSVTWTVRGDTEGEYNLSADYVGSLEPIDEPVRLRAVAANPLKVWGASALKTTIVVDRDAHRWTPYQVDVNIQNISPVPVYNLQIQMLDQPADHPADQADYVFAPAMPGFTVGGKLQGTGTLAGCANPADQAACPTFTASYVVFPGLGNDEVHDLHVVTADSFVQKTGGDVDLAPTIVERCTPPAPADCQASHKYAGPVTVTVKPKDGQDQAHLTWLRPAPADNGATVTGYQIWTRQKLATAASEADDWLLYSKDVPTAADGQESYWIPASARAVGRFYAIGTVYSDGHVEFDHGIGAGPARYVALGDSYSAGEGVPAFEPGTASDVDGNGGDKCHRSAQGSYSRIVAADPPDGVSLQPAVFAACSGAIAADVVEPNQKNLGEHAQVDQVNEFTNLITLSMGGNDIGFNDIGTACILGDCTAMLQAAQNDAASGGTALFGTQGWAAGMARMWDDDSWLFRQLDITPAECDGTDAITLLTCAYLGWHHITTAAEDLTQTDRSQVVRPGYLWDGTLVQRLTDAYLALAHKAPHAQIVVMPYPDVIAEGNDGFCQLGSVLGHRFGLSTAEIGALHNVIATLNADITEAQDRANQALADGGGWYQVQVADAADMASAFAGKALCEGGTLNSTNSDFNGLVNPVVPLGGNDGPIAYSLHPNAKGQQDYAAVLEKVLSRGAETTVLTHPETLTQAATITIQGSSPDLQGSSPVLQGSSPSLQGGSSTLVAQLSWPGSTATLHLTAPDGTEVDASTPGVTVDSTPTTQTLSIPNAQLGKWKVAVFGDDVAVGGEPATVSAYEVTRTPEPPQVTATADRVDQSQPTFDLSSTATGNVPDGSTYTWYFSDNTTATGAQVRHTFDPAATTWWATVEVSTPDGRTGWGSVDLGGPASAPTLTQATPPTSLAVGDAVSYPFAASGAPAPTFSATGNLPPGLTLSANGVLSGVPTSAGAFTYSVTATNSAGSATAGPFSVTVAADSPTGSYTLDLTPASATAAVGTQHQVTAAVAHADGRAASTRNVLFTVSGANPTTATVPVSATGQAAFTLAGAQAGTDTVTACYDQNSNGVCDTGEATGTATTTWTPVTGPTCNGLPATIVSNASVVNGTPGDDVIVGGPVSQQINGQGGNDTICGGDGNDVLSGGAGNDWLDGQGGMDMVIGGVGDDVEHGGDLTDKVGGTTNDPGNDQLFGDAGSDQCFGVLPGDVYDTTCESQR